jgi:hypothetical protein
MSLSDFSINFTKILYQKLKISTTVLDYKIGSEIDYLTAYYFINNSPPALPVLYWRKYRF